jgi:hypothetical protein
MERIVLMASGMDTARVTTFMQEFESKNKASQHIDYQY